MKIAHSNVLGELLGAEEVEHEDTAAFQIVCPCCTESVFKVTRAMPNGRSSQFFSHRQATNVQIEECEMRVGSISQEQRALRNTEARGQTLVLFQSYMRRALALDQWCYGDWRPERVHSRLAKQHVSKVILDNIRKQQIEFGLDNILSDELPHAKRLITKLGISVKSAFATAVQERVAIDMLRHLLSPQGKDNHQWLLRHTMNRAYIHNQITNGLAMQGRGPSSKLPPNETAILDACMCPNQTQARKILMGVISNGANDTFYEMLTMNMVFDLLRLPYAEMLENHRAGRPALHGIQPSTGCDKIFGVTYDDEPVSGFKM